METIFLVVGIVLFFGSLVFLSYRQSKENEKSKVENFKSMDIDNMMNWFVFDIAYILKLDTKNKDISIIRNELKVVQTELNK